MTSRPPFWLPGHTTFCRATWCDRPGNFARRVDAQLEVFEDLSAAQYQFDDRVPGTKEACGEVTEFFDKHLGHCRGRAAALLAVQSKLDRKAMWRGPGQHAGGVSSHLAER